jgi:phosphoribosylglycinamide formyltransferase-1
MIATLISARIAPALSVLKFSTFWRQMLRVGVCASGGGGNLLNLINSSEFNTSFVISHVLVDRPCGAIEVAREHQIACVRAFEEESIHKEFESMFNDGCDLIVLAGFMPILGFDLCRQFQGRIINTHPSLLPKHGGRGMYGVRVQEAVLAAKDKLAGCTVHFVNEEIDGGEIIVQISFQVPSNISAWDLGGMVFNSEAMALPLALKILNQGQLP